MKRDTSFVLILSILILLLTSACNNSVDDMLEGYNGGFNQGYVTLSNEDESPYSLEPDDSGYDQTRLLYDDYTVFDIGTLNLIAPASCKSFKWTLTDPDAEDSMEPISVTYYDGSTSFYRATQDFIVYVPDSGLETGHTYKLTLVVRGKSDGVYTDSCLIYIVKYYVNY